ncbi:MAG: response regulator [Sandaracinaceae bacterium]|nr:response regulator [Sandaracinaceae bacterium]
MPAKILIVDDEENHRKTLGIGLRLEGYAVAEAADGEEGLTQLDNHDVDLAIVDLMMPGMNGLEFARRVRFEHPRTRVVLTSAYHLTERQLERAAAGVIGFVAKPYSLEELVGFLSRKLSQPPPAALSA